MKGAKGQVSIIGVQYLLVGWKVGVLHPPPPRDKYPPPLQNPGLARDVLLGGGGETVAK